MIQYSCMHVYNFFPDYVFLACLYARNVTKEKVAKITQLTNHILYAVTFLQI